MKELKGRHLIFIIGIISAVLVSRWSEETASNILVLLLCGGAGIWFKDFLNLLFYDRL